MDSVQAGYNMRFTVIYINEKSIRDKVISLLISAITQGLKLNERGIMHPIFLTQPRWPIIEIIERIPLHVQCEEMEYLEGSLRTLRVNTVDVEVVIESNENPDNNIPQSN